MRVLRVVSRTGLAVLMLGLSTAGYGQDQQGDRSRNHEELAHRIVSTSAAVKPGEVVVIVGGKHTIPLMEALAIEAQKAGGLVTMFLNSDRVIRARNVEVPEEYLDQERAFFASWLEQVDVWIGLPGLEDFKSVIAGVPEARFAKLARANQVIIDMLNDAKLRAIFLGYPTKEQAANDGLDFETFERLHWDAVNADYAEISKKGNELRRILEGAKSVRITSPRGTELTFSVGDRPIFVSDGIVTAEDARSDRILARSANLPGGELYFAPIESSGNGKVVVPRTLCRFEPLTDVSFELRDGKMTNFQAGEGRDCFEETMRPYSGPKDMLGTVFVGLNPALKVIEDGADYRPGNAAGMVWLAVGNNKLEGGENIEPGGFEFPLTNATVEVDGKVVLKDGQLAL